MIMINRDIPVTSIKYSTSTCKETLTKLLVIGEKKTHLIEGKDELKVRVCKVQFIQQSTAFAQVAMEYIWTEQSGTYFCFTTTKNCHLFRE